MKSYVEIAKKMASEKRIKEAAKAEKEKNEGEHREAQVNETMRLLKKALKQWGDEEGFSYKDCGKHHHVDCAEIHRNGRKILGFRCHWDRWEAQYSDDCKSDEEGISITVTFSEEQVHEWNAPYGYRYVTKTKTFRCHFEPSALVERCMGSVAEYLSKYF